MLEVCSEFGKRGTGTQRYRIRTEIINSSDDQEMPRWRTRELVGCPVDGGRARGDPNDLWKKILDIAGKCHGNILSRMCCQAVELIRDFVYNFNIVFDILRDATPVM